MSDDDRLADYLARMDNPEHRRELDDGCTCGDSIVACNASRYVRSTRCCASCSH